jgi:hypothetical protein
MVVSPPRGKGARLPTLDGVDALLLRFHALSSSSPAERAGYARQRAPLAATRACHVLPYLLRLPTISSVVAAGRL